jgi:membrane-anchored protein YejM (alkaline phosphatase superfamily)
MKTINFNHLVGNHNILFIVLDTLRYDVACTALSRNLTPVIANYLAEKKWGKRHSPATFTYPAHHAFFAGFLPTPARSKMHPRLFAPEFIGSETTCETTWLFKQANVVEALAAHDYHTSCIGGVGFFNKQNAIGSVFPNLFAESHWQPSTGVACKDSTENQVNIALTSLQQLPAQQRLFSFINISALHQPNYFYLDSAEENSAKQDSVESQMAALAYVDAQLEPLFHAMQQRAPTFCILCSDHGTCYGEDGYYGHKVAHEVVLTVPYAHFFL